MVARAYGLSCGTSKDREPRMAHSAVRGFFCFGQRVEGPATGPSRIFKPAMGEETEKMSVLEKTPTTEVPPPDTPPREVQPSVAVQPSGTARVDEEDYPAGTAGRAAALGL